LAYQPSAFSQDRDNQELPVLWEHSGHDDRIKTQVRYIAHDAQALAKIPLVDVPVDFETQMVLIASPGPVRSPDVTIRIRRLWTAGPRIRSQIEVIHPTAQQKRPLKLFSPYHLIVVPKSDRNVEGFTSSLPKRAFVSPGPG